MKILVVSQVFWPENFRINDLCSELVKLGHEVTVITGKPNYPKGKFYDGYSFFSRRKDSFAGSKIIRVPVIPRGTANGLRLSLNYLSFAFFGSIFSLFHAKKYDFSFVYGVSPITAAFPSIIHRFVYKTKMVLWVLDLWPESVEVSGKLSSPLLKKMLHPLVKFIYKQPDKIFISSQFMKKSILEKINSKQEKDISYLPNWAEDSFYEKNVDVNKYASLIPDGFIVMFAGNIGFGQDCQSVLKTAQLLQSQHRIKFVFLGDGSEKLYMEEQIKKSGLEDTVIMLGSYPLEEMPNFYCHADAMLIVLKDETIFSYTVPGKLQTYMACCKPIAGMINGESAGIITQSESGIVSNAGDYEDFAKKLTALSVLPKSDLAKMGENGFNYCRQHFKKENIIHSILNAIQYKAD